MATAEGGDFKYIYKILPVKRVTETLILKKWSIDSTNRICLDVRIKSKGIYEIF